MTAVARDSGQLRWDAARIAFAVLRFEEAMAHAARAHAPPGHLRLGIQAYEFLPSWRHVPREGVEAFLVSLPSPALLAPTTVRGVIALTLLHELSGDRRRWAEKTFSNFAAGLDDTSHQLGLSPTSRVLLEFEQESHVFSLAAVREWTQQFAVHVGWNVGPLESDSSADACLRLVRSDGQWFRGRSCMVPRDWRPLDGA
jgi:hypothetical protein